MSLCGCFFLLFVVSLCLLRRFCVSFSDFFQVKARSPDSSRLVPVDLFSKPFMSVQHAQRGNRYHLLMEDSKQEDFQKRQTRPMKPQIPTSELNRSWQTLQEMTCFFLGTMVTPKVWLMTAFCTGSICGKNDRSQRSPACSGLAESLMTE